MREEKRPNVKKLRKRIERLQQKYKRRPSPTGIEVDFETYFGEGFEDWNIEGWTEDLTADGYPKITSLAKRTGATGLRMIFKDTYENWGIVYKYVSGYPLSFTMVIYLRVTEMTYVSSLWANQIMNLYDVNWNYIFRLQFGGPPESVNLPTEFWVLTDCENVNEGNKIVLGEFTIGSWDKIQLDFKVHETSGVWRVSFNDQIIFEYKGDTVASWWGESYPMTYLDEFWLGYYTPAWNPEYEDFILDFDDYLISGYQG